MADLRRLLDVQDHDLSLDQLRHRRDSLPERGVLAEQESAAVRLQQEITELEARVTELQRTQKRLEDEIDTVETKAASESRKLNSGTVTAPRELQALDDEVKALGRRQRQLEDELLEVLEPIEELTAEIEERRRRREEIVAQALDTRTRIAEQEAEIGASIEQATAARADAAAQLDAALLERYEKLRKQLGGVAVARLEGAQCLGCHVSLPAMEVDAARHAPADAIIVHEDCGRILVR